MQLFLGLSTFVTRLPLSHSLRDVRILTSGDGTTQMGRAKHSSTRPDNPRSPTRRRLNGVPTATTYDDGVVPRVDDTVRIMSPGNGYLKFGVVKVKHLYRNSASEIPYVRVKLYNGDFLVRPQNDLRVYDYEEDHGYQFYGADGKFVSIGDKVKVLYDDTYTGKVEELVPNQAWIKRDSGEYEFADLDHVVIMEEYPTLT